MLERRAKQKRIDNTGVLRVLGLSVKSGVVEIEIDECRSSAGRSCSPCDTPSHPLSPLGVARDRGDGDNAAVKKDVFGDSGQVRNRDLDYTHGIELSISRMKNGRPSLLALASASSLVEYGPITTR